MLPPLLLSLRVSIFALAAALPIGILAAWWISRMRTGLVRTLVETLLTIPLVLPPSAVGVGLLLALGRGSEWGSFLNDRLHIRLVFTVWAAVIASAVVSVPLIVRTIEAGLSSVATDLSDAARVEGASEATIFAHILLPLSYRSVLAGATLGFARAFGEFGATLLVAGAISGETETLPLALYAAMDRGDSQMATRFMLVATAVAFALLFAANRFISAVQRSRGERDT